MNSTGKIFHLVTQMIVEPEHFLNKLIKEKAQRISRVDIISQQAIT